MIVMRLVSEKQKMCPNIVPYVIPAPTKRPEQGRSIEAHGALGNSNKADHWQLLRQQVVDKDKLWPALPAHDNQ